jgi:hypothetical protein
MPSSPSASALPSGSSGRPLRRALFVCFLVPLACAQSSQRQAVRKAGVSRINELTLGGLRPGRDTLARATLLNKEFGNGKFRPGEQMAWFDDCRDLSLTIDSDKDNHIEVLRAGAWGGSTADCWVTTPSPWKTGLGLRVWDPIQKLAGLYGQPDSKSPSTRDGQPLELWYYAFDWAGPNVPQVMEVLCTREKDGQPGRVVEITLAAPSL